MKNLKKNDEDDAEDNSIKIENDIQDGNVDNNIKQNKNENSLDIQSNIEF